MEANKSRIKPRSRLTRRLTKDDRERMDSVKFVQKGNRAIDILMRAEAAWDALDNFRRESFRNYRYTNGDQWGDEVKRGNKQCKERDAMIADGNVPLTNNLIHRLVRTLVGLYRKGSKIPFCVANDPDEQDANDQLSAALQVNWKNNERKETDAKGFERFLITGWAMQKEVWGYFHQKNDSWSYSPQLETVFWDTNMNDERGWDCSIIGEIHDMPFNELCRVFAHSPKDHATLRDIYHYCRDEDYMREFSNSLWLVGARNNSKRDKNDISFLVPKDHNLCRVIEVWTVETKPRYVCHDWLNGELFEIEEKDKAMYDAINEQRMAEAREFNAAGAEQIAEDDVPLVEMTWYMANYWYVRYLSPAGDILDEHPSEYKHCEHPYSLKLYPFTNGEVRSFVADIIDQQRYVNRLISLNDKLVRSAAKGILLYPISKLPDGMTPEQVQRNWNQPQAVMFYNDAARGSSPDRPDQLANRLTNLGTSELLQLEMQMMEEISGVNGALQGKPGFSGQSAALYAQQTQNASVATLDLVESYENFVLQTARKKLKNIQQFYDKKQTLKIVGREPIVYDPELCGDIDSDVMLFNGIDSPDMRRMQGEMLSLFYQQGAITPLQLVELSGIAYSQRLKDVLAENEQKAAQMQQAQAEQMQGAQPQGDMAIPQEVQQEVADKADQTAVRNAERILKNYELLTPEQAEAQYRQQQQ